MLKGVSFTTAMLLSAVLMVTASSEIICSVILEQVTFETNVLLVLLTPALE